MNVSSYIFQSPYPQAVQFGRPDPVAEAQKQQEENTKQLSQTTTDTSQKAEQYQYTATSQTGSSVNVAASSTDSGVTGALAEFTSVNTQVQAAAAYSA